MKCPNCGAESHDEAKFCSVCGKSLASDGNASTESTESTEKGKDNGNGNSMAAFGASLDEAKTRLESGIKGAIENDRKVAAKAFPDSYLYELFHTKKLGTQLAVWSSIYLYICCVTVLPSYMYGFFFNLAALALCVVAFIFGKNEHGDRSHLLLFNIILAAVNIFSRG